MRWLEKTGSAKSQRSHAATCAPARVSTQMRKLRLPPHSARAGCGPLYFLRVAVLVVAAGGLLVWGSNPHVHAQGISPPSKPTGLSAAPGVGQVTLSWTDPDDDSITGYDYYHIARYKQTVPSDRRNGDLYGNGVSIDGDTMVGGSPRADTNRNDTGSAYVFVKPSDRDWTAANQVAKLTASDGALSDELGRSVSVHGDTIVVGAHRDDDDGSGSGSAYVFVKPSTGWVTATETAKLTASDGAGSDEFGLSVSVHGDTIVVGAHADDDDGGNSGSAYVFVKPSTGWVTATETAKLTASDGAGSDEFGRSVSVHGDTIVVGAHADDDDGGNSGSAYVFVKPSAGWANATETAKLTASDGAAGDEFGRSVSVHGDTIVVGAHKDNDDGNDSGSAYVFVKPSTGWVTATQTAKLTASDGAGVDRFGSSVSVDGDNIVVGAALNDDHGNNSGSAYVFVKPSTVWVTATETAKLTAGVSRSEFGSSVSVGGDAVAVGSPQEGFGNYGAAYVFVQVGWERADGSGVDTTSHTVQELKKGIAYAFRIRAVNGTGAGPASDVVRKTPHINSPPQFATATATLTVIGRTAPGVKIGAPITATDPDTDDTLVYSLSGTDADSFDIDAATGQLKSKVTLDYETKASHQVTVEVTDGKNGLGKGDTTIDASISVAIEVTETDYDADGDHLIEVSNLAQLNAIRWDLNGDGASTTPGYASAFPDAPSGMGCADNWCRGYELTVDLDFDTNDNGQADVGDDYWNNGAGWEPIGTNRPHFSAIFEGNGHVISNLFINRPNTDEVGLFARVASIGFIFNTGVEAANISGREFVGSVAGITGGLIKGCHASGTVVGFTVVGGIAGYNSGKITTSYATNSVEGIETVGGLVGDLRGVITSSYASGSARAMHFSGGLVGHMRGRKALIVASYVPGSVSGDIAVGGLVGVFERGQIISSYVSGSVHRGIYGSGGFVGAHAQGGLNTVTNGYWDIDTTGRRGSSLGAAVGKSTSDLRSPLDYSGIYLNWNSDTDGLPGGDDPWDFGTSAQYPVLKADLWDEDSIATWQEFGNQRTVPGPPEVLATTSSEGTYTIAWTPPAKDGGSYITSYDVRYIQTSADASDDANWTEVENAWTIGELQHVVPELGTDNAYNFQVRAVNVIGDGPWSANARHGRPAQPTGLNATPKNARVILRWTDPSDANIEKYQYRQKEGTGEFGAWTDVPGSDATTTSFTRTGLTNGTEYSFQIRAVNPAGNSPESDTVSATPNLVAPAKPTGLAAEAGHARVTLTWDDPSDSDIASYQYRQKEGEGEFGDWSSIPDSDASTTTYLIRRLTNGVPYIFQIRAVNGGGESPASDSAEATPLETINAFPIFAEDTGTREVPVRRATRTVSENTAPGEPVGNPVTASDFESGDLVYSLRGPDAPSFEIGSGTSQIVVGSETTLNFETEDTYSVLVVATDPQGSAESIDVTINVTENTAPVAEDDSTRVINEIFQVGSTASQVTINVLANDYDPDGDDLYFFSWEFQTDNGSISLGATLGSVIYTPNHDFVGIDEFNYTIIDGIPGEGTPKFATATVTVVVYRPPEGPDGGNVTTVLIEPGAPGIVGDPDDDAEVEFPKDGGRPPGGGGVNPFQVQVTSGVTLCSSGPRDQILVACVQVDLYDLAGVLWDSRIPAPFTIAEMTIRVPDTRQTSVYRRSGTQDTWAKISTCNRVMMLECFNVSAGGIMVANITEFSQFAVTRPRTVQRPIGGSGGGGGDDGGGGITPQETPTVTPTPTPEPTPAEPDEATPTPEPTPVEPDEATPTPEPTPAEPDEATPTPDPALTRPASTLTASRATRIAGSAGPTATPTPVGARTMGSSGSTPELPLIVPSATAPPAPASTRPPAPGDTPAPIAALSPTSGPATTAMPSVAVEDRGFPLWLWILIAAALLLVVVLLYTSRRLLRRT